MSSTHTSSRAGRGSFVWSSGQLLAATCLADATIDALVVATAARREPAIILTSDVDDIVAFAADYPHVRVEGV